MSRRRLGEILLEMGAVSIADVESVLDEQSAGEPSRLGDTLVELGKVTPEQLARALSEQYGLPFVNVPPVAPEVQAELSLAFQRRHRALPFARDGAELSVAIADPSDVELVEAMKLLPGRQVRFFLAPGDQIDAAHAAADGALAVRSAPVGPAPQRAPAVAPSPARRPAAAEPTATPAPVSVPVHHLTAEELFADLSLEATAEDRSSSLSGLLRESASRLSPRGGDLAASPDAAPTAPGAPPRAAGELDSGARFTAELYSGRPPALDADGAAADGPAPGAGPAESEGHFGGLLEGLDADGRDGSGSFSAEGGVLPEAAGAPGERPIIDAEVALASPDDREAFDASAFLSKRDAAFATPSFESFSEQPLLASPSGIRELKLPPASLDPLTASRAGVQLPGWLPGSQGESPAETSPATATPVPARVSASSVLRLPEAEWTGALDATAPSKLVVALVKALLRRGLVSERELLEALKRR